MDRRKISKLAKYLKATLTNESAWSLASIDERCNSLRHNSSGYYMRIDSMERLDFPHMECLSAADREYIWPEVQALKEVLLAKLKEEQEAHERPRKKRRRREIFKTMVHAGLGIN